MSWRYQEDYPLAGKTLDPRDITRTYNTYASEVNGFLDGDNVTGSGAISTSKLATKACNSLDIKTLSSTVSIDSSGANQWVDLTELQADVTCVDGVLVVDAWIQAQTLGVITNATGSDFTEFQIVVGGTVVASTDWKSNIRIDVCHYLSCAVAVGAGIVTVLPRIKVYRRNPAYLEYVSQGMLSSLTAATKATYQNPTPNNTVAVTSGALIWRHQKR
jgi:hypothetical protein